ncbi:MAG: hypothetical protein MK108_01490 [Mariniblastus sp.]|nr:hypothetical protein [Mariniblastus sp.]
MKYRLKMPGKYSRCEKKQKKWIFFGIHYQVKRVFVAESVSKPIRGEARAKKGCCDWFAGTFFVLLSMQRL